MKKENRNVHVISENFRPFFTKIIIIYIVQLIELEAESAFGLRKNLDDSDDTGVDSD